MSPLTPETFSSTVARVGEVPRHYLALIALLRPAEFIHLLASEASEVSERQQKKVISPEHVLEALATLGFPEYIDDVKAVHREYKEQASVSSALPLLPPLEVTSSPETSSPWQEQT